MLYSLLMGYGREDLNNLLKKVSDIESLESIIEAEYRNNSKISNPFTEIALILLDKVLEKKSAEIKVIDDLFPMKHFLTLKMELWRKFVDNFAEQIKAICIAKKSVKEMDGNAQVDKNNYQYCLPSKRNFVVVNAPKEKPEKPTKQKRKVNNISTSAELVKSFKTKKTKTNDLISTLSSADPMPSLATMPMFKKDTNFANYMKEIGAFNNLGFLKVDHIRVPINIEAAPVVPLVTILEPTEDYEIKFFVAVHELFLPINKLKNMIILSLNKGAKTKKEIEALVVREVCHSNDLKDFSLMNSEEISCQLQKSLKDFSSRISGVLGDMKKNNDISYHKRGGGYGVNGQKEWDVVYLRYYRKDKAEKMKNKLAAKVDYYMEKIVASINIFELKLENGNYRYLVAEVKDQMLDFIATKLQLHPTWPGERLKEVEYIPFTDVIMGVVVKIIKKYLDLKYIDARNESNQVLRNGNNTNNKQLEAAAEEISGRDIDLSDFYFKPTSVSDDDGSQEELGETFDPYEFEVTLSPENKSF